MQPTMLHLNFLNDRQEVYSTSTSFKATTDLQIVGLNTSNVKTKTGTINWSFHLVIRVLVIVIRLRYL